MACSTVHGFPAPSVNCDAVSIGCRSPSSVTLLPSPSQRTRSQSGLTPTPWPLSFFLCKSLSLTYNPPAWSTRNPPASKIQVNEQSSKLSLDTSSLTTLSSMRSGIQPSAPFPHLTPPLCHVPLLASNVLRAHTPLLPNYPARSLRPRLCSPVSAPP